MKKDQEDKQAPQKKRLVLRKESIRQLDRRELSRAMGGTAVEPTDGGAPPPRVHVKE